MKFPLYVFSEQLSNFSLKLSQTIHQVQGWIQNVSEEGRQSLGEASTQYFDNIFWKTLWN